MQPAPRRASHATGTASGHGGGGGGGAGSEDGVAGGGHAHVGTSEGGAASGRSLAGGGTAVSTKQRPKLMFLGPKSGGKSSIRKVVFERMAPNDTLFIEKTAKSTADDINSFISIQMWDLPGGQLDPAAWNLAFEDMDAVIFVLDAQSTLNDMIRKLAVTMQKTFDAKPAIQFEIFLHKIDGMSEDYRLDTLQNLRDRLTEELFDLSPDLESSMNVFYHLTSVFDTSIYEALSKVIQKLIPEQAMLERLLDLLCQQCSMDKAFLFDTSSKIYIATDSSPLDNQTYVICSDYIDLIGDFSLLYEPSLDAASPYHSRSPSTGSRAGSGPNQAPAPMLRLDQNSSAASAGPPGSPAAARRRRESASGPSVQGASGEDTTAVSNLRLPCSRVKLQTGATIAQWGINQHLSLVALLRPHTIDQHAALIDYNVATIKEAVLAIFDLNLDLD